MIMGMSERRKPSARGRAVRSKKREGAGMGRRGSGPRKRANSTGQNA